MSLPTMMMTNRRSLARKPPKWEIRTIWVSNLAPSICNGLVCLTRSPFAIWRHFSCVCPSVSTTFIGTFAGSKDLINGPSAEISQIDNPLLCSLIIRQQIPYIRAIRSIPREMKDKLPPELVARLDLSVRHHPLLYEPEKPCLIVVQSKFPNRNIFTAGVWNW